MNAQAPYEIKVSSLEAEVAELTEAFNTQRRVIVLQRETLQRILRFAKTVDSLEADAFARIAREGLFPKS